MMSSRFSVSVHILTLLARAENEMLSSEYIAGSININPVLVRKELINLRKNKLVATKEGKNGGSYLLKSAAQIYLSDIYVATRKAGLLGKSKNKPNPACEVGRQIEKHLSKLYEDAEKAILAQLGKRNLKTFAREFN